MTRFGFKGYFDIVTFQVKLSNINLNNYKYINFGSDSAQKIIFGFYKTEMQQGGSINASNLGQSYIRQSGFYDLYPKRASWEKFKCFCPHILYSFEIYNNIIWLIPINVNENNRIYKSYEDQILKL